MTEKRTQKSPLINNNPQHKLTREDSIKGGKAKSKYRDIIRSLQLRKYCDGKCPLYDDCWARPLIYIEERYKDKKTGKYLCALKSFSEQKQKTTVDLFLRGEDGLKAIMKRLFMIAFNSIRANDPKEARAGMRDIKLIIDTFYGEKHRTQVSGELGLKHQTFIDRVKNSMQDESRGDNQQETADMEKESSPVHERGPEQRARQNTDKDT
jgi:hypothetical protein